MKQFKYLTLVVVIIILNSCSIYHSTKSKYTDIDYQAHRGGRGLMPENTIQAMLSVMDNPSIKTLEMDLAITKDKKVVVSHDPILNPLITLDSNGLPLSNLATQQHIIYQMNYDSLAKFDVGLKMHPGFTQQKKLAAIIPRFTDLIDSVENKSRRIEKKFNYNIEIKSVEGRDLIEHPIPEEFAELVVQIVNDKNISARTTIQSFDLRPLKVLHEKYPTIPLSYLVYGPSCANVPYTIEKLGFYPAIYSPEYKYITKEMIDFCHKHQMKIIPWTINTKEEINHLIALGVDGIISDYPNLYNN